MPVIPFPKNRKVDRKLDPEAKACVELADRIDDVITSMAGVEISWPQSAVILADRVAEVIRASVIGEEDPKVRAQAEAELLGICLDVIRKNIK